MTTMPSKFCATCGKDGEVKACKACQSGDKYCITDGQLNHREEDKKKCKEREAKLFADPPPREECPICFLTLPLQDECVYQECCGNSRTQRCPFCNAPDAQTQKEYNDRLLERIEKYNDPEAMYQLGNYYNEGMHGFALDFQRANELHQRASNLGCAVAHTALGNARAHGRGVEKDMKKAVRHFQDAAIMGSVGARFNLGILEACDGNLEIAVKHFIISAKSGCDKSLQKIKEGFMIGVTTKEDFEKALRAHKNSQDEMRSDQRDLAKSTWSKYHV
eukprot:scaffold64941_cov77-Cyclotella_meneghiniana.AAC.12